MKRSLVTVVILLAIFISGCNTSPSKGPLDRRVPRGGPANGTIAMTRGGPANRAIGMTRGSPANRTSGARVHHVRRDSIALLQKLGRGASETKQ